MSAGDQWLRGSWMQTFTGRQFFPLDPRPEEIDPADIAHALSLICRYGGHTKRFYSVAEHCWLMSYAVPEEHALWALLHDATEAYVGDMVRPLKHHMPEYRAVEDRVMAAIAERFNLSTWAMPDEVKDADNRILLDERAALLSEPPVAWQQEELEPLNVRIEALGPAQIERLYRWRLNDLAAAQGVTT
jgi:5'-deoxynucleotidase YfbR-like HD superfamily hydrolase